MLLAVAVTCGWNASDAHEITVSPENPTGYRWLPGPAKREKVRARRPSRALSRKWKWLSIHSGSMPATRECGPDCQSSHQKSTPSASSPWCSTSRYAARNSRSVTSKEIGSPVDASRPSAAAIAG